MWFSPIYDNFWQIYFRVALDPDPKDGRQSHSSYTAVTENHPDLSQILPTCQFLAGSRQSLSSSIQMMTTAFNKEARAVKIGLHINELQSKQVLVI